MAYKLFEQAVILGAITGMRSSLGIASIINHLNRNKKYTTKGKVFNFLVNNASSNISSLFSTGEIIVDKIPDIPPRISMPQLIGRGVLGCITGMLLYRAKNDSVLKGGIIAAGATICSTFISYKIRQKLTQENLLEDTTVATIEDITAIYFGKKVFEEN